MGLYVVRFKRRNGEQRDGRRLPRPGLRGMLLLMIIDQSHRPDAATPHPVGRLPSEVRRRALRLAWPAWLLAVGGLFVATAAGCGDGEPRAVEGVPAIAREAPPVLTPSWWVQSRPIDDPLSDPAARLLLRVDRADVAVAERLYGPAEAHGALRGWWLRPLAPQSTGTWLMLSVSGGIYGVSARTGESVDAIKGALWRAARSWRVVIRDHRDTGHQAR